MGAIMLLFRTKGRSLAALGAVVIVLLLAIDSFFQQVVDLPNRWTLQLITGTIPRVVEYRPNFARSYKFGVESMVSDQLLQPVAKEFFYSNGTQPTPFGNGTRPDIPLSCPTNNCTWPPYETLAICGSCADVTDVLNPTYTCLNMTIEWSAAWFGPLKSVPYPNGTVCGQFLNVTSEKPTLLSGYILPEGGNATSGEALLVRAIPLTDFDTKLPYFADGSIAFKDIRYPILDALISSTREGRHGVYHKHSPLVHECMLVWCVRTMQSSYTWGLYKEEIISTYFEPKAESDRWPWETFETPAGTWYSYTQNLTLAPPSARHSSNSTLGSNDIYQISNDSHSNIMNFFDDFFPSFYTAANITTQPALRHRNYGNGPAVRTMDWNPWEYPNNVTNHIERLALAMTSTVRSSDSKVMLEGEAYLKEPYIEIRWVWLTFPLFLLVLSLVFLVATMIKTSGDGATGFWKTSAMPTLIYSLPKEAQGQFASSATWNSGKGAPRKTRIKLLPNMGWRVSGQSHLSRSPRLPSGERVPRGWI
jgi:hypothetical protein